MAVRHILKDGTEVESIAGRVIRQEDFRELYRVIDRIGKKEKKGKDKEREDKA